MSALDIVAAWVGTSVFVGGGYFALLYAVRTLRNSRNQSTRESEAPFAIGGGADFISNHANGDKL